MLTRVTIIVPVYNTGGLLGRCIDSIMAQSYADWHLMLIDDQSTDTSLQICQEYARHDSRISVYSKPNGGAASARNFGIEHVAADCEFITFCDSDDSLCPDYLSRLIEASTGTDCVICGMIDIYPTHTSTPSLNDAECSEPLASDTFLSVLKTGLLNSPCNKLYRRSILHDYGIRFDPEVYCEDITFNINYFCHCHRIVFIKDALYCYHHRAGSVTGSVPERAFDDYVSVQRMLLDHVPENKADWVHDFVSYQYMAIALRFMRKKQFDVAYRHLKDPMVKKALSRHKPYSRIDQVQTLLMRLRLLRLYSFLFLR